MIVLPYIWVQVSIVQHGRQGLMRAQWHAAHGHLQRLAGSLQQAATVPGQQCCMSELQAALLLPPVKRRPRLMAHCAGWQPSISVLQAQRHTGPYLVNQVAAL
jgi:hypothetical protein